MVMDKNTKKTMFSSASDEWSTDDAFYEKLNQIFFFTLDPCATDENHKCEKYYTIDDDGLAQDWRGENAFVNNPYSNTKGWTKKCAEEGAKPNTTVVQLIPSRTDTKYSQLDMFPEAQAVLFVKGRLKFGGSKNSAPFPSMVPIYRERGLSMREIEMLMELGELVIPVRKTQRWKDYHGQED